MRDDLNKQLLKEYLINNNQEAYEKLIKNNFKLVTYITHKYPFKGADRKEFYPIATDGLITAIKKFDIKKIDETKFGTCAYSVIKNEIYKEIQKRKNKKEPVYFSELNSEDNIEDEECNEEEIINKMALIENKEKLKKVLNTLKPMEKKIISMLYGLDDTPPLTQAQISKELGVSRTLISVKVRKIMEVLKARFNNTNHH